MGTSLRIVGLMGLIEEHVAGDLVCAYSDMGQ